MQLKDTDLMLKVCISLCIYAYIKASANIMSSRASAVAVLVESTDRRALIESSGYKSAKKKIIKHHS